MELVCERDAQRRGRGFLEVCDVSLLALVPRGLRILEGVRTLADDVSGTVAEALANVTESCLATLVLCRIVEQRCDGLVLELESE